MAELNIWLDPITDIVEATLQAGWQDNGGGVYECLGHSGVPSTQNFGFLSYDEGDTGPCKADTEYEVRFTISDLPAGGYVNIGRSVRITTPPYNLGSTGGGTFYGNGTHKRIVDSGPGGMLVFGGGPSALGAKISNVQIVQADTITPEPPVVIPPPETEVPPPTTDPETNAISLKSIVKMGGGGLNVWAGDVLMSSQNFLEDGRNIVTCDGSAIDSRFVDLLPVAGSVNANYITFNPVFDSGTMVHDAGAQTISGSTVNKSTRSEDIIPLLANEGDTVAIEFTLTTGIQASQHGVVGLNDQNDDGRIDTGSNRMAFFPSGFGPDGNGVYGAHPYSGFPAFDVGDTVGFAVKRLANTNLELDVLLNGVSQGTFEFVPTPRVFLRYGDGGATGDKSCSYKINSNIAGAPAPYVGTLPNYLITRLPYKVVAQNPDTAGIPDYAHPEPVEYGQFVNNDVKGENSATWAPDVITFNSGMGMFYSEDLSSAFGKASFVTEYVFSDMTSTTHMRIGFTNDNTASDITTPAYNWFKYPNTGLSGSTGYTVTTDDGNNYIIAAGDAIAFIYNKYSDTLYIYIKGAPWQSILNISAVAPNLYIGIEGRDAATVGTLTRSKAAELIHNYDAVLV